MPDAAAAREVFWMESMGSTEQGSRTELEEAHHWFNLFMGDVEHKKIILSNRIKLKLSQMFATVFKHREIHIFAASQPEWAKVKWRKTWRPYYLRGEPSRSTRTGWIFISRKTKNSHDPPLSTAPSFFLPELFGLWQKHNVRLLCPAYYC